MNMPLIKHKTKQNPGLLSFISQKIRTAVSANVCLNSILSSQYYIAVRKSQIPYMCLSFQIDSPLQLNTLISHYLPVQTRHNFK